VSGDFSQTAFLVGVQMQVLECGSAGVPTGKKREINCGKKVQDSG